LLPGGNAALLIAINRTQFLPGICPGKFSSLPLDQPPLESSHGSSLSIDLEFSGPNAWLQASSGSSSIFAPQHSGGSADLIFFPHDLH
jgi:hypothetical protein